MYLFLALWSGFSLPVRPFGANIIKHKRTCLSLGQDGAKPELKCTEYYRLSLRELTPITTKYFVMQLFFFQEVAQGNDTMFTESLSLSVSIIFLV